MPSTVSNTLHIFMETTLSSNEILGQVKIIIRQLYVRSPEDLLDPEETEFLNHCRRLCTEVDTVNPVPGNACIAPTLRTMGILKSNGGYVYLPYTKLKKKQNCYWLPTF